VRGVDAATPSPSATKGRRLRLVAGSVPAIASRTPTGWIVCGPTMEASRGVTILKTGKAGESGSGHAFRFPGAALLRVRGRRFAS
jgi:hypothetical protein